MQQRIIIYQMLPRLYANDTRKVIVGGTKRENGCGKLSNITTDNLDEIRNLGCNYVWYTGVIAHATKTDYTCYGEERDDANKVKGEAGSPYAIKDYYAVSHDLIKQHNDRLFEWKKLVNRSHHSGLKVIMDFVPNHLAADYKGTQDPFTEYNYYPGKIHDGDWTDTAKLNYENHDTWQKMLNILLFWAETGVDGFRCDMAELVPCDFWEWAIPQVKDKYKVIFIAEVYNPDRYREYIHKGHFDYLYDKVGLYDTLKAVVQGASASLITQCWQSVDDINDHMLNFLENHDEVRIASDFYAGYGEKGRPALLVSALLRNNPFMLYFGQEFGERGMDTEGFSGKDGKTSIFDYWVLDCIYRWRKCKKQIRLSMTKNELEIHRYYSKVLNFCNLQKAIRQGDFYDIMYANYSNEQMDTNKLYAFLRKRHEDLILVIANFSQEEQKADIIIPQHAFDCLDIPQNINRQATDLLSETQQNVYLSVQEKIHVRIPANDGRVLKIVL